MTDSPRRPWALYALVLLAISGVLVAGNYGWQQHQLKQVIIHACNQRTVQDDAITEAARKEAEASWRQAELSKVAKNLPAAQQAERTRLFEEVARANEVVVAAKPTRKCSDYR